MGGKRTEILSELQSTKQALRASEKRGRRAVRRLRDLEKALADVKPRLELWAGTPLPDDSNAFKALTVGDCRRLLSALTAEDTDAGADADAEPEKPSG